MKTEYMNQGMTLCRPLIFLEIATENPYFIRYCPESQSKALSLHSCY